MRRGFSLPELVLVLAVAGILSGIAVPLVLRALDRLELEAASARLVAAHQRARMLAITRSQVLTLSIDSAEVTITVRGAGAPFWSEMGPSANRVALAGPVRRFTFSPVGFTMGLSNATLKLTRGGSSRTIVISRLGRIRVLR